MNDGRERRGYVGKFGPFLVPLAAFSWGRSGLSRASLAHISSGWGAAGAFVAVNVNVRRVCVGLAQLAFVGPWDGSEFHFYYA